MVTVTGNRFPLCASTQIFFISGFMANEDSSKREMFKLECNGIFVVSVFRNPLLLTQ